MIILDTNVLSESVRPHPNTDVLRWLASKPASSIFTTAITQAEILFGLETMPQGKRRSELVTATLAILEIEFAGRILPFDSDAAHAFAQISASRRSKGRPMSEFDAQIAAIARSLGATLATRNTADFAHCGIELINPWEGF